MKLAFPAGLGVSRLDRYLFLEMALPFLFGVVAFSSLVMAIGSLFELVRLMVENGLALQTAMRIFVLRLPGFIVLTFPMSMLLATLLAYSRLSADSEIVALKACGVGVYRMIIPAAVLSLGVTALTFFFNESLVPSASYEASVTLAKALNTDLPSFQKYNIFYQEFEDRKDASGKVSTQLARILYASNYDNGVMTNMKVLDFTQERLTQIVTARQGIWLPRENKWLFKDGVSYVIDSEGNYRNVLKFAQQQINLSRRPIELVERSKKRPEEMTITELRQFMQLAGEAGQDTTKLAVQYYLKYALPWTCLAFALIGSTLGMRPQRTTGALGLGVSVLIIFAYYVLSFLAQAWGQLGYLSPIFAAWLPNLITLSIGGVLLWRAAR
ncbi:LptF/LptG family permease [Candidatus Cyanaurora vandensis]|uniref:LptF/LptG family permease n=1 Tax=Candidatus Cyanaurora vandensis TaxID=2714958 RepID=UPI00257F371F|nr:LptF/LptG family permease [Candidatus Cyanaurora vandensis]